MDFGQDRDRNMRNAIRDKPYMGMVAEGGARVDFGQDRDRNMRNAIRDTPYIELLGRVLGSACTPVAARCEVTSPRVGGRSVIQVSNGHTSNTKRGERSSLALAQSRHR